MPTKPRKRTSKTRVVSPTIRVRNIYTQVSEAVNSGAGYGLRRSIKHVVRNLEDEADLECVREEVVQQIMNELCELLDFGETFD